MNECLSKKISIYNFIFTIGIVIYHSKNFHYLYSNQSSAFFDKMYNLYDLLASISLGFFFMVSAYLFYLGLNSQTDLYAKMKKRLYTIGIPFLAWNALVLAYEAVYGIIKGNLNLGFSDFALGFTFEPFDGPLWYMFALLLLMVVAPLIYKLKEHPNLFLGILIGIFVVCSLSKTFVVSDNAAIGWIMRLVGYIPLYFMGAYFGLCKSDFVSNEKYNRKFVAIVSACISVVIVIYFVFFGQSWRLFNYALSIILPVALWLSTCNSMYEKTKIRYPIKISFFIYAMHMLLIGILNTILTKIVGNGSLHPVLAFFGYFVFLAVLYFICLAVAYIAGKILPAKLYFALSGGRVSSVKKSEK